MSQQQMPVALDPLDFPLHGSRLIEASAGTGKTFTIALLYVRLVLDHGGESAFGRPLRNAIEGPTVDHALVDAL
ncbi:UvrD-helicase domain-containing protein, partial [Pseudomonas aeruginosa]|uniref:UvrD-helicase domain-containing protein n=1 Tax=Pseudomonas aeruginosa TaxID=287 RepID=UPI00396AA90A